MTTIAVYNLKGGVGKTSTAVNLAWCAANSSGRRTLIWDLDPQAAATYLIGKDKELKDEAQSVFIKSVAAQKRMFFDINKKKYLKKMLAALSKDYDRIILDCPPGLTETSDQILRAADLVIVPVIPSPLSQRAFFEVQEYLDGRSGKHAPMLPVYSMVDRRRAQHKKALDDHPDWPIIPYASLVEQMAMKRAPLGSFASANNPVNQAYRQLWTGIERKIDSLGA
jgi:cellulose biosynthesis protein BcsQ